LHDILTVLLETGCRPQEARHIAAQNYRDGIVVFAKRDSKGNLRQRVIRLSNKAREIVLRQMERFPTGPVLRNGNTPWTSQSLNDACKPFGFTPYQVRHTFATNAFTKGVDIVTVAKLMGHTSTRTLLKVYQHVGLLDGHLQDAIERINA
jgi:integrase